jgi:biopolymer transport protein TolR
VSAWRKNGGANGGSRGSAARGGGAAGAEGAAAAARTAWRRRSPAAAVRPEINVTPLVDVVLVLLIIFMVVAPRMDQDVPVELPGILNPDPEVKAALDPLKVSVAKAGEYYIGERRYDLDGAIDALAAEHAVEPLRRLVLRADARLTYGDVRALLARAQAIGFPGLSFMVGERQRGREEERRDTRAASAAATGAAGAAREPGDDAGPAEAPARVVRLGE